MAVSHLHCSCPWDPPTVIGQNRGSPPERPPTGFPEDHAEPCGGLESRGVACGSGETIFTFTSRFTGGEMERGGGGAS